MERPHHSDPRRPVRTLSLVMAREVQILQTCRHAAFQNISLQAPQIPPHTRTSHINAADWSETQRVSVKIISKSGAGVSPMRACQQSRALGSDACDRAPQCRSGALVSSHQCSRSAAPDCTGVALRSTPACCTSFCPVGPGCSLRAAPGRLVFNSGLGG